MSDQPHLFITDNEFINVNTSYDTSFRNLLTEFDHPPIPSPSSDSSCRDFFGNKIHKKYHYTGEKTFPRKCIQTRKNRKRTLCPLRLRKSLSFEFGLIVSTTRQV